MYYWIDTIFEIKKRELTMVNIFIGFCAMTGIWPFNKHYEKNIVAMDYHSEYLDIFRILFTAASQKKNKCSLKKGKNSKYIDEEERNNTGKRLDF